MPKSPFSFETLGSAVEERLPDLDRDAVLVFMALVRLGRTIERDTAHVLKASDLEASEHSVMSVLWLSGPERPLSPAQLSQFIVQTPSGMTKTIRRLERAGLVEKTPNSSPDGRFSVLLTPVGTAMAERHFRERLDGWDQRIERGATVDGGLASILWSLIDTASSVRALRSG